MRLIGQGIDLVEVARIGAMVREHGDRFYDRCFTHTERAYAEGARRRDEHLAARFAAKEAALKALGTGWRDGIAWTDIEVVLDPRGRPGLRVTGKAAALAANLGITEWSVSLTHTGVHAAASVLAMGP